MPSRATESAPHRLRELRESADESRAELAVALGFKTDKQIDRWEAGHDIPTAHARKLAQRYGVSLSWLMRDEEAAA